MLWPLILAIHPHAPHYIHQIHGQPPACAGVQQRGTSSGHNTTPCWRHSSPGKAARRAPPLLLLPTFLQGYMTEVREKAFDAEVNCLYHQSVPAG